MKINIGAIKLSCGCVVSEEGITETRLVFNPKLNISRTITPSCAKCKKDLKSSEITAFFGDISFDPTKEKKSGGNVMTNSTNLGQFIRVDKELLTFTRRTSLTNLDSTNFEREVSESIARNLKNNKTFRTFIYSIYSLHIRIKWRSQCHIRGYNRSIKS